MWTLAIDMILTEESAKGKTHFELDQTHNGILHQLLSNRALIHQKNGDFQAAVEDAEACCQASPGFEKGHLRLLDALVGLGATREERTKAATRGLRACPTSKELEDVMDVLVGGGGSDAASPMEEGDEAEVAAQLEATRLIADDPADPRRCMASGDLGSIFATGAHGLPQDLDLAEKYLSIGATGGDAPSQRNYGLLLLDTGRPAEGAEELRKAATQGDEEATRVLGQLGSEAKQKAMEAKMQLGLLASQGDERAREMLETLTQQGLI